MISVFLFFFFFVLNATSFTIPNISRYHGLAALKLMNPCCLSAPSLPVACLAMYHVGMRGYENPGSPSGDRDIHAIAIGSSASPLAKVNLNTINKMHTKS